MVCDMNYLTGYADNKCCKLRLLSDPKEPVILADKNFPNFSYIFTIFSAQYPFNKILMCQMLPLSRRQRLQFSGFSLWTHVNFGNTEKKQISAKKRQTGMNG